MKDKLSVDEKALTEEKDLTIFLDKMKSAAKGNELDLSMGEDLSIGIMNLISIEEHLFFTANKTGKDHYYGILNQIREIRKELLKKIVVTYEGEAWCIGKHLLASSMRLMEVGTKALNKGDIAEAKSYFEKSYRLFRMFWEITLRETQQQGAPQQHALVKKNVVMFYDDSCPHCKNVEEFLTRNGLYTMFNIEKKEVSSDTANHAEMEKIFKNCLKSNGEMVVPMVYQDEKCAMGEEGSIRLFKSLMWDNVKEIKQAMEALVNQSDVPAHIKSHVENYNKTIDTALNCCKE
jgi:glutaredoxin